MIFFSKKNKGVCDKKNNYLNRGFTLVEMLVSITIFSLVIGAAVQLFFYSLRVERSMKAHSQLISEMSYNLEHIGRGLRMAKKSTDGSCLSAQGINFETTRSGRGIKFQEPNAAGGIDCVEYYWEGNTLKEYRRSGGTIFTLPLTSPSIKILSFGISDFGWNQNDTYQPRVTLHIRAQYGSAGEILENQITVSRRDPDIRE